MGLITFSKVVLPTGKIFHMLLLKSIMVIGKPLMFLSNNTTFYNSVCS